VSHPRVGSARGRAILAVLVLAALVLAARQLVAQDAPTARGNRLDSLRFSGIGLQVGVVRPLHIESAPSLSLVTDYGEIGRAYRIGFTASYWGSRFNRHTTRTYLDSLRRVVIDPSGDDSVRFADIDVSDISLAADVRRMLAPHSWLRPYLGGGLALHFLNADGPLIDGTFVERALDNIAVGIAGSAGLELVLLGHVALGAEARYDLFSLARYGSVRVGATYYFDSATRRGMTQR
jgi:opacity protein-like surface antigen